VNAESSSVKLFVGLPGHDEITVGVHGYIRFILMTRRIGISDEFPAMSKT